MENLFRKSVKEKLELGVILEIEQDQAKWFNRCFLIKKPDNIYRMIVDCRQLNQELKKVNLKFHLLQDLFEIVLSNDFTTGIDIKAAFHNVQEVGELQHYLCFKFDENIYSYIGMPFWMSLAPQTFNKILCTIVERIRKEYQIRCLANADDLILMDQDREILINKSLKITKMIENLDRNLLERNM
ncbi:MAG: hypothetical protein EZS28_043208 [Streblomastix strix]|uniref:Reverse transcriptase domain-containing protein n=1 Tax=Streblomastix strix TaxID=222440 RepID=A0A5J4TV32_9EUKA|nr:MAG: hypothetical protein EZS28_043208 [Streblomastix strix]